jgi:hypothetical protein
MDLPGAVSRRYDQGLFGMTRGAAFMDVHQNLVRFGWQPPSPNRPFDNGAGIKKIAQEGEAFIHHEDEAEAPNKGKRGS